MSMKLSLQMMNCLLSLSLSLSLLNAGLFKKWSMTPSKNTCLDQTWRQLMRTAHTHRSLVKKVIRNFTKRIFLVKQIEECLSLNKLLMFRTFALHQFSAPLWRRANAKTLYSGNSTLINLPNAKFSCFTAPSTRHHSFFRNETLHL